MKVWITKYALTKGIYAVEGEINHNVSDEMFSEATQRFNHSYLKPQWHETKEEAIEQAEKMRTQKIKSLERQLAKMKALKF